jgi:UDP-N-acetylglucosamine diphosphorylase/glucosamine-1-phosphate N-acetyltransferase
MKQLICLFEDSRYSNLHPLVYMRPVYDLQCGILTLREKAKFYFPKAQIVLHSRSYLKDLVEGLYPKSKIDQLNHGSVTFINGRLLINSKIAKVIARMPDNHVLYNNDGIIAVKSDKATFREIIKNDILDFENIELSKEMIDAELINYPWELININGNEISNDFKILVKKSKRNFTSHKSVVIINRKSVFIDKGCRIGAFTVLDASDGPIYIGKNVDIYPHVIIKGPVYIGENSIVKSHTSIYQNTSIGKYCKVGGEIINSIIHSYCNKQHEGFLGHSYLGSWVNIGAGTINSNLKNNYGNIDVYLNGLLVNTESQFVGLIMGDHSKTAINTMFNTGTVVGVSCNVFGSGFPPKYIPSFSWGGSEWLRTYNLTKCIEVAKLVMKRRGVELNHVEENLLEKVFELTKNERRN